MAGNDSFWDGAFSNNYHYQIVNKISEITRIDNGNQYSPARSKKLIRGIKSFKITTPAVHVWIGVGTRDMAYNRFPGYTPEAWMIDTSGQLYHNNVHMLTNRLLNFLNKTVIVKVDVPNASLTIDGVTQRLGDNLPPEVYFVIAVRDHSKKILLQELE